MHFAKILIVGIFIMASNCYTLANEREFNQVSILSLIVNPLDYDESAIYVDGVFDFIDEQAYIYATKDYYESKISTGRIILEVSKVPSALCLTKGSFVTVFGSFKIIKIERANINHIFIHDISQIRALNSVVYPESHSDYGEGAIELLSNKSCSDN